MTIPTDPYNSPQRRPFDEGHILKPLCEERPKAADFGHSTATRPDAKRPDTKGRADAGERTDAIEGAGTNERPEASEESGERRASRGEAASGKGGSAPSGIVFTRATQVPSEPNLDDTRPRTLATPLFRAAPETPSAWNADSASTASPATTSVPHSTAASPAAAHPSTSSPEPPQATSAPPRRPPAEETATAENATLGPGAMSTESATPDQSAMPTESATPAESPTAPTPPMPSDSLPSTAPTPSITPEDPEETAPNAFRPSAPQASSNVSGRGEPGESPAAMRESLAAAAGLGSFASSRAADQPPGPADSPAVSRHSPTRRSRSQTPAYSQAPGHSGAGRRSPAHSLSVQSAVVSAASPSENKHPIRTSLRRALADDDADRVPTTGGVSSIFSDDVATTTFETSRDIGGTYESATSYAGGSAFGEGSTFGEGSVFGTDSAFDTETVGGSLTSEASPASEAIPASSSAPASDEAGEADSRQASPASSRRRAANADSQRAALDDGPESDVPAAPKKRAAAHVGVLFATILLVPPAWYVVSDAHARLVAAYKDSSVDFAGAGELVGGLAILALIWFFARASSLGAAFTGWIVAVFGALGLALPRWTERSILDPISQRLEGNGFTRNVANLLAYDMLTGLIFVFGGVLILTGAVSHWARRRGHKYGVLIARRTLALESLQEYENVYVPASRARRAEPTHTNET